MRFASVSQVNSKKVSAYMGRRGYQTAVTVVGGSAAVIGEDVLAVVLNADVVAVDERNACGACLRTEKAVALTVFAQRVGGAGKVAQKLCIVCCQRLRYVEVIVFRPAVFAQHDADAQGGAADDDFQRMQCFADTSTFFGAELLQAVKMTAVVKFAVVGQRCFDEEAASLITAEQLTVLAGKGGVVFAHASVLVELAGLCGNAAED